MSVTDPHPPGEASKLTALPHQERVADKLENAPEDQGLLAAHSTGSGKTFTAINAAKRLKLPILAITPASLRTNFTKEMDAADNPVKHQVVSYQEALNRINNPEFRRLAEKSLVVMDEAHNMGQDDSARSKLPGMLPGRKLLLSGTPVRNAPHEIAPLINAAAPGSLPEGKAEFNDKYVHTREVPVGFWGRLRGAKPGVVHVPTNLNDFATAIRGKVDFHENLDRSNFPSFHESIIEVPMTPKQQATYEFVLGKYPAMAYKVRHGIPPSKAESKNMNAFFSGPRQISNHPGEFNASATDDDAPKFKAAADEIDKRMKGDKNFRGVIYSNFLEAGMEPMARELERRGVPYLKFNGEMNDKEKAEVVKKYNGGDVPVLLISGAGAEGLDLKGTKLMQIMEPHWNEEKINQVRGRAIRYKSHAHLPEEERHVEVHRYHAVPVMGWLGRLTAKSPHGHGADEYIYNVAKEKQDLNQPFLDVLRREGGEREKDEGEKAAEVESFVHVEFVKEAISPFQTMVNLPRMVAPVGLGPVSSAVSGAIHGAADALHPAARAVDRTITRAGNRVGGAVRSLFPQAAPSSSPSYSPGEISAHSAMLTKKTGVPHDENGNVDFEHPRVKGIMDMVNSGKLQVPEQHLEANNGAGDEIGMWQWADDMAKRTKQRTVNIPGFGNQNRFPKLSAKIAQPILSQLYPDDPTKRFDYSHEIKGLQAQPATNAADAKQKAEDARMKAIDKQLDREEKAKERVFKEKERAFKAEERELKMKQQAEERELKIKEFEEERIVTMHEMAAKDIENASKGVEIAQKALDAANSVPEPVVAGAAPAAPAEPAKAEKPKAKEAEWTSPANMAVHAQKHGDEFGGQLEYINAENQLSRTPPEDLQILNTRCRTDVVTPQTRCSTAYFSPSTNIVHVKDNGSQKTISLYKRSKPFPALKTRESFDPISGLVKP